MSEITEDQIIEAGFTREMKKVYNSPDEPSGRFLLPGYKPLPYIEIGANNVTYGRYHRSGAQMRINTAEDIIKFRDIHIPLYAEKVNTK